MKPLTKIDTDSCALIELAVLFSLIAAHRWADKVRHDERPVSFFCRELTRRTGAFRRTNGR